MYSLWSTFLGTEDISRTTDRVSQQPHTTPVVLLTSEEVRERQQRNDPANTTSDRVQWFPTS
jgi:hypothetical protein